ncbi:MAG: GTP-binding nuclear protein gsp1/Ran [Watsoniomyces obsoletus]|nr:MAG: GTP-binding nuclear protein gsp1/Ran [Watsoniomyces obsoletus]
MATVNAVQAERKPEPGEELLAVHDFNARGPDELSMAKGDRIELIERDDEFNDGWYLGRHQPSGRTGLFPQCEQAHPMAIHEMRKADLTPGCEHLAYTKLVPAPLSQAATAMSSSTPIEDEGSRRRPSWADSLSTRVEQAMPAEDPPTEPGTSQMNAEELSTKHSLSTSPTPSSNSSRHRDHSPINPRPLQRNSVSSHAATSSVDSNPSILAPTAISVANMPYSFNVRPDGSFVGPGGYDGHSEGSGVMNQTLSVIDEHITDMHTPRQSLSTGDRHGMMDSASDYSSQHQDQHRLSYITGHETDDEEQGPVSEAEVARWSSEQVGDYLRRVGVEESHCETFVEQEITGDVLLGMDQASLFIKEFELGSIGRRLRTWQAIKSLQEEVKAGGRRPQRSATNPSRSHAPSGSLGGASNSSVGTSKPSTPTNMPRTRTSMQPTVLPRIPSLTEPSPHASPPPPEHMSVSGSGPLAPPMHPPPPAPLSTSDIQSRPTSFTSHPRPGSPRRPSAASIRDFYHSRRPSSVDFYAPTKSLTTGDSMHSGSPKFTASPKLGGSPRLAPGMPHKKQASFDRNWTMDGAAGTLRARPATAVDATPPPPRHDPPPAPETAPPPPGSARPATRDMIASPLSPDDLDRGYFSQGETEGGRPARNVLRKRQSGPTPTMTATQSRRSSYTEETRHRVTASNFRHSRFGSADSIRDVGHFTTFPTSPAAQAYYGRTSTSRFRRNQDADEMSRKNAFLPLPPPSRDGLRVTPPPTVTKLDASNGTRTPNSPATDGSRARQVSSHSQRPLVPKARTLGPRVVSDAVTGAEKAMHSSPAASIPSPIKESPVQSPTLTGSSTPSGAKSFELSSPEATKTTFGGAAPPPSAGSLAMRRKSKKETSAYQRGLERKTPQEQMIGCDYSGWMKKKSTNLMASWKPRLFVLRGRRLSYYYSDRDDQERGLIDISGHRVLPADNDRLTGLHATLTGATTSPTSPQGSQTPTMASADAAAAAAKATANAASGRSPITPSGNDSTFIFKLVPPRAGMSRAVNFTRPTVHYFAVDNVQVGRLWMAALMKATISRDDSRPLTTTYQQPTISLTKARQMGHRPPALMGPDEEDADGEDSQRAGDEEDNGMRSPVMGTSAKGLNIGAVALSRGSVEGSSRGSVETEQRGSVRRE